MALRGRRVIDAAMVPGTGVSVTAAALAGSVTVDSEACRIGLVRKMRRAVLTNGDPDTHNVQWETQDAAGGNDTALARNDQIPPGGVLILEPESDEESILAFLSSPTPATGVRRLGVFLSDTNPKVAGVHVQIDYYDDLER